MNNRLPDHCKCGITSPNTLIEGATIYKNTLVLLSTSKMVYTIDDLNEFEPKTLCDLPYGYFNFMK